MEIRDVIEEFRERVKQLYGEKLAHIILYGSWARGEAKETSDIDLLIVLKGNVRPGKEIDRMIEIITDLNLKYCELISVHPISLEDYSTVRSPLLRNIRREGIPA